LIPLCEEKYQVTDRDIVENSEQKLKFRKYPYPEWIGGTWLLAMALFVIYILNTEMRAVPQSWLQWIALFLMLVGGLAFIVSGQTITTEFEGTKTNGTLLIVQSNILCQRNYECYSLADVVNVQAT